MELPLNLFIIMLLLFTTNFVFQSICKNASSCPTTMKPIHEANVLFHAQHIPPTDTLGYCYCDRSQIEFLRKCAVVVCVVLLSRCCMPVFLHYSRRTFSHRVVPPYLCELVWILPCQRQLLPISFPSHGLSVLTEDIHPCSVLTPTTIIYFILMPSTAAAEWLFLRSPSCLIMVSYTCSTTLEGARASTGLTLCVDVSNGE